MHNITVQELKQRKDANETLYILDVREPSEYAEVNMGAKLIPLGQVLSGQIDDIEDWKDKEVIVHCRSGVRSLNACMMLEQLGFINTKNLEGGIIAWVALNQ
ncbi:MAG: rhodanese-like domain-containing protein [Bacteroidetes bacterium]|jgi:rhodanese-related sulfurtransferase|nr:rhodanese-like domain-containing protein [Bacteroidota bacterium]MBK6820525.1 rhodanese-like domain-containing protein [Bacteroidota bacterium]MBK7587881.1 rhodanese-like domain-containing protein [Bacteroidota bacterium]MBK8328955.1 rhodanese-like domain-containing protein [Bacteroidota bacterium]MBK9302304.1 rhodanese-like domain-containing protein [Bacteroidota bacterium]